METSLFNRPNAALHNLMAGPGYSEIEFFVSAGLVRVPKTLDECSPRALRILLVPNREPFFVRERDRDPLGLVVTLVFRALVGMVWICNGVNLPDRVRRGILAKSALYDDVIMSFWN